MTVSVDQFSPILIGTCNRINHFRNLIGSLQACMWAERTELYIAIDAPYADEVCEVNQKIQDYSKKITGFSKVNIINRPYNLGPVENFNQAIDEIFKRHETIILLEDDNVVSRNFLVYMNKALSTFASDKNCFAVCGYSYANSIVEEPSITDVYFAPYQSGWGVAYWREKYTHPALKLEKKPDRYFLNPLNLRGVCNANPPLFPAYIGAYLAGQLYGDQQICIQIIKNKQYCVYPRFTKVINNGFDGSGTHCGKTEVVFYSNFEKQDELEFKFLDVPAVTNQHLDVNHAWLKRHINITWLKWIYAYFMYVGMIIVGRDKIVIMRNKFKSLFKGVK